MASNLLPSSFPFNVPPGLDINTDVGFAPTGVIVNNYTPYYIYLPDGLSFVAPWTTGAVMQLSHATRARATWGNTPYGTENIVATSYSAQLTYTNDPSLGVSGGTAIPNPFSTVENQVLRFVNSPAATLLGSSFPVGGTLSAVVISGVLAGAGNDIGSIQIYVGDGVNTSDVTWVFMEANNETNQSIMFPADISFPALNPAAPSWSFSAFTRDHVGVNAFYASISYYYHLPYWF